MFLGDVISIIAICQEIVLCQLDFLSGCCQFIHLEVRSSYSERGLNLLI